MGILWSILFKILLYLALIGIIHACVVYTQNTFTRPKKRIVSTDHLLYKAVEEKLKETIQLDVRTQPQSNDVISTTPIDCIPTNVGGSGNNHIGTESIIPNDVSMKDQLKNFLKSSTSALQSQNV